MFQRKIKEMQAWHEIPEDLIINFDQTPLSYICAGNRTYAKKGSSNVPVVGKGKKSRELSQLLCLDHFFPCSLSIKEWPIIAPVDTRTKNVRTKDVHKRTFIFGSIWKHGKTSQSERLMNVPM